MKKILLKAAAFAVLLLLVQVPAELLRGWEPIRERDALSQRLREGVDAVYFGDSVLNSVFPGDADQRDLFRMVQDRCPELRMEPVSGLAYSMDVYLAYVRYLARQERRPRTLILPVNLRSFSPEWDPRPEYQYQKLKFRLRYGDPVSIALLRPLGAFKAYSLNPVSQGQFRALPVFREGREVGRVRDFLSPDLPPPMMALEESQFVFRYLFTLEPGCRKLQALRTIVDVCRRSGMTPVFYVTPVDVASGEVAGPGFRKQVQANVAVVRDALAGLGLPLLDLSCRLDRSDFDWRRVRVPNEHLNEGGRREVARELEAVLRRSR